MTNGELILPYMGSLKGAGVEARALVLPNHPQTFSKVVFIWVTYPGTQGAASWLNEMICKKFEMQYPAAEVQTAKNESPHKTTRHQLMTSRHPGQKDVPGWSRGSISNTEKGEIARSQPELLAVPRPSEPR